MRRVVGVLALAAAAWSAAADVRVSVREALQALVAEGHAIVFSDDLVSDGKYLTVDAVTLPAIKAALPTAGLRLEPSGNHWLVVADETTTPPEPTSLPTPPSPALRMETVIVTGSRHHLPHGATTGTVTTLSAEEMSLVPSMGGDSMRVANRLPGMSSVGVSAKPRVRGGLQDEFLIMVDGIELLDAFHLADFQSIFSAVDDRTVDAIDVYTGGFPARYGNRMSGVMEVSTLEQADKPGTELGLSVFSALINTRGVSADEDTDWLVSARHGNLDLLTNRLNARSGDPKYSDAYGRVGHRFNSHTKLSFGGFWSQDDVELADGDETAESDIDSRYLWTRLDAGFGEDLRTTTVLSYVRSDREKRQLSPNDEDVTGFLDYDQHTRKIILHSDFSQTFGINLMEYGVHVEYAESEYDSRALIDRGEWGGILGREPLDVHDIHVDPEGWSGGLYWSAEYILWGKLSLLPGLRWDFQDYFESGRKNDVSPRLGIKYRAGEDLTLRLDVGRFHQPEAIHEMQVTDGVDHFFPTQHADHWIAAVEWLARSDLAIRAEVYRKKYNNPKVRFENLFNPFVLLPELEPDRVPLAPREAEAYGFDLEIARDFNASLTGTLRYSYMDADDHVNDTWVPRRWSQRHTVNAIATYQAEDYTLSAALTWHTGWRTSTPPPSIAIGETIPLEEILNNTELREFLSFDVSASRSWRVGRTLITAYADITNLFDRNNQAGIDYDVEEVGDRYVFFPDAETLLPIIPSVGILISF